MDISNSDELHLRDEPDLCKGCGANIGADAVLCINCGFDKRKGRKISRSTLNSLPQEKQENDRVFARTERLNAQRRFIGIAVSLICVFCFFYFDFHRFVVEKVYELGVDSGELNRCLAVLGNPDSPKETVDACEMALVGLGSGVVPSLFDLAEEAGDDTENFVVWVRANSALVELGDMAWLGASRRANHPNPKVRFISLVVLCNVAREKGDFAFARKSLKFELIRSLLDPDEDIRQLIIHRIDSLVGSELLDQSLYRKLMSECLEVLLAGAAMNHSGIQSDCLETLCEWSGEHYRDATSFFRSLEGRAESVVARVDAARCMIRSLKSDENQNRLMFEVSQGDSPTIALATLLEAPSDFLPQQADSLLEIANHSENKVRVRFAKALRNLNPPFDQRILDVLTDLQCDKDFRVRREAEKSMELLTKAKQTPGAR